MPLSAVDAINPAFQHAKAQLLKPFRFGQWARLALVGLLTGELGGGGCNFNFSVPPPHHEKGSHQFLGAAWPPLLAHHPEMFVALVVFLALLGIGLGVLLTYINSMMRFILFDSIVAKECRIRQGWARRKHPGFRFFVWQIVLMLISLAAFAILIGIPLAIAFFSGWTAHPGEHLLRLVLGGVALFFVFFVFVVLAALIQVMTKDFVVPQMALEEIGALEGWRRLWPGLKAEKGSYAGYIGMKIVLAIGAGIAFSILAAIVVLVLLIPIGGFAALAVLAGKAAGLTWNLYTITLAAVVGCIALAILIFAVLLVSVPVVVFFPAYSIYFFAARYTPLAALLSPPSPTSFAPTSSPLVPPPLPPSLSPSG